MNQIHKICYKMRVRTSGSLTICGAASTARAHESYSWISAFDISLNQILIVCRFDFFRLVLIPSSLCILADDSNQAIFLHCWTNGAMRLHLNVWRQQQSIASIQWTPFFLRRTIYKLKVNWFLFWILFTNFYIS